MNSNSSSGSEGPGVLLADMASAICPRNASVDVRVRVHVGQEILPGLQL
jgi:hypothetical protein